MNNSDIEHARLLLKDSANSPGKDKLVRILAHSETLLEATRVWMQCAGQKTGTITEFYDALAELKDQLKNAHDLLWDIDKTVLGMCIAREIPPDSSQVALKVIRAQSREIESLVWTLPDQRRPATESS